MPLSTQIIRDGEPLSLRWSDFHVAAMAVAAAIEGPDRGFFVENYTIDDPPPYGWPIDPSDCGEHPEWAGSDQSSYPDVPMPITRQDAWTIADYSRLAVTPLNEGSYTLQHRHQFVDCTDGEILELLPGDVLEAFRD